MTFSLGLVEPETVESSLEEGEEAPTAAVRSPHYREQFRTLKLFSQQQTQLGKLYTRFLLNARRFIATTDVELEL